MQFNASQRNFSCLYEADGRNGREVMTNEGPRNEILSERSSIETEAKSNCTLLDPPSVFDRRRSSHRGNDH